jgi:hypothetical protein
MRASSASEGVRIGVQILVPESRALDLAEHLKRTAHAAKGPNVHGRMVVHLPEGDHDSLADVAQRYDPGWRTLVRIDPLD